MRTFFPKTRFATNFKFLDQQIAAEKCAFRRHPRGAFVVELRALRKSGRSRKTGSAP
jgi:hypothetical protein